MLKKTITFEDLDGNPVTEDFYFNLSKAEIAELELSQEGGLSGQLKKIVASKDGAKIVATFKDILTKSIGRRSEDGRRFIKSEEITNEFLQSNAYSELFMSLMTDEAGEDVSLFIQGIIPASMQEAMATAAANAPKLEVIEGEIVETKTPVDIRAQIEEKFQDPNWVPNKQELMAMSPEQLQKAFQRKSQ